MSAARQPRSPVLLQRLLRALGLTGGAVGCAAMVSMLPGAAASALGALGVTGSSAFARTLSPVAQPLFVGSAIGLIVGALACSRLVTVMTAAGAGLLYLSMWILASAGASSSPGVMTSMTGTKPSGVVQADTSTFWTGLIFVAGSLALSAWRRRRERCRPFILVLRSRRTTA